ncbi:MAG: RibD family protein, partial [Candidatus Omnitrophica bacterium]|nr:RibD family protein [Candidatus Omnitrophota bacterium]
LPFVAVKVAQSLDGKIATRRGASKWITEKRARLYSRSLRDKYDAVLVGVNTVIKDNPKLNGNKKVPFKIILDPDLIIPKNSYIFKNFQEKLIIVTSFKKMNLVKKMPPKIKIILSKEVDKKFDLKELLKTFYNIGITSIFVEGGSYTLGSFFDQKVVDKIYFFIAPKIIGGKEAISSIGGLGCALPNKCISLKEVSLKYIGKDILLTAYPYYQE